MDTILCYLLQEKKIKLSSFKDKLVMTNIQKNLLSAIAH